MTRHDIYHMTSIINLGSIFREQALLCGNKAPMEVNIGHTHIKSRRGKRNVSVSPFGTLNDFVPFYFAPRSPMLYAIKGGRVEGVDPDQSSIAYLVSDTDLVLNSGLEFCWTDAHAELATSEFFKGLDQLESKIDWHLMRGSLWFNNEEFPDRKERRQAEFLVHERLPLTLLKCIVVYDERAKRIVESLLMDSHGLITIPIEIKKEWYF